MIIACNPIGGLGNQLFQIFSTIAYGIQYNRQIRFNFQEETGGSMSRPTYWKTFLKNLHIFTTMNEKNKITNTDILNLPLISENGFHYSQLNDSIYSSVRMSGFFQSYKYFEKYLDQILKMIQFSEMREKVLSEYSHFFAKDKTNVSMHFRLGDYKYLQEFHPILNVVYYIDSLTQLLNKIHDDKPLQVLYFYEKNDHSIVHKEYIEVLTARFPDIVFLPIDVDIIDWKQMLLMTLCDHNIIANSTFSWWGAYLNPCINKCVMYPSVWFGNYLQYHIVGDLFPEVGWTKC